MGLSLARRILARFPALRWGIAAALERVPALDRRLRAALGDRGTHQALPPVDAAHLPEDAMPVHRALGEAIARRRRR